MDEAYCGLVKDELINIAGAGAGGARYREPAAPVMGADGVVIKSMKRRKREPPAVSGVTDSGNGKEGGDKSVVGGANAAAKRSSRFRGVSRYTYCMEYMKLLERVVQKS
jgi:hypothetical protein